MRPALPSGTVTLLFTDIEGSTKLLHELGDAYAAALAEHRRALREAFSTHGGVEVDTQGDAFFYAFETASDGMAAAKAGQGALEAGPIRVRMGLHTGEPVLTDDGYVGLDVHKAARIAAAGHGGQVLVSAETRALVADAYALTDLGEHRVKDFQRPVWVYQLGDGHFPPLKTISNTNLPRPASSFVGRQQETAEVVSLLHGLHRLVTLSGPGGSGKSRIAIEAAVALVDEFRNGVFWVGLASVRDPTLVLETIAQTLGAKNAADHIGDRELLLVLDNFEQVVDAAPQLSILLRACPNLRVIVTSRERLRIDGELEYAVPPLATADAIQLFGDRAGIEPDASVAELTRRLDNLPLAIELAAARTSVLSPQEILELLSQRLDLFRGGRDADPRQKTLRATIAWSYELLEPDERALLRRLSVFVGGWTLRAAEEIADGELDTLGSLVDKSLIRKGERRFWMLETIREFAAEELGRSNEQGLIRDRHMGWYAAELSQRELAVRDHDVAAVSFVQSELENARAALTHALDQREHAAVALLLWGTATAWLLGGRGVEGFRLAQAVIDANLPGAGLERLCMLSAASSLFSFGGDMQRARQLNKDALDTARPLAGQTMPGGRSIDSLIISLQCDLADLELTEGDVRAARRQSTAALTAARAGPDPRAISRALTSSMWAAFIEDDIKEAISLAGESVVIATRLGRTLDAAGALILSALSRLRIRDTAGAGTDLARSIDIVRHHPGRSLFLIELFIAAAQLSLALGQARDATTFMNLATKVVHDQGQAPDPIWSRLLSEIRSALGEFHVDENRPAIDTEDEALELAAAVAAAASQHEAVHPVV